MGYGEVIRKNEYWGKWGNIGKSWIVLRESANLLEKHGIYAGYFKSLESPWAKYYPRNSLI